MQRSNQGREHLSSLCPENYATHSIFNSHKYFFISLYFFLSFSFFQPIWLFANLLHQSLFLSNLVKIVICIKQHRLEVGAPKRTKKLKLNSFSSWVNCITGKKITHKRLRGKNLSAKNNTASLLIHKQVFLQKGGSSSRVL